MLPYFYYYNILSTTKLSVSLKEQHNRIILICIQRTQISNEASYLQERRKVSQTCRAQPPDQRPLNHLCLTHCSHPPYPSEPHQKYSILITELYMEEGKTMTFQKDDNVTQADQFCYRRTFLKLTSWFNFEVYLAS
jgi:hypothetical protein